MGMGYTVETWLETFKPIKNHISNEASWDGIMFETYGDDIDFVINQPEENTWTYLDDEFGNCIIVAGYWLQGRIGYFITEVARDPKDKEMWDDLCIMAYEGSELEDQQHAEV